MAYQLPQCTLAAARNAARNGSLTAAQFAQWCANEDILTPRWCAFLTDCCAGHGEVAVPIDIDFARQHGPTSPRLMVLQTTSGRHAITFFVEPSGDARRFDNDDLARLHGTFTWVDWDTIIHEWRSSAGNAMYGLVPTNSPLTTTNRAREAFEREHRRRRVLALQRAGVHDPRERARILRAEDRRAAQSQATTTPPPAILPQPGLTPVPITHAQAHAHTYVQANTHARAQTHANAHVHAHAHTHTLSHAHAHHPHADYDASTSTAHASTHPAAWSSTCASAHHSSSTAVHAPRAALRPTLTVDCCLSTPTTGSEHADTYTHRNTLAVASAPTLAAASA